MLYPQRLHGEQCCTTSEVPDAAIQQDGPGIPLLPFPLNPTLFVTEQTHVQTMERRLILSSCPLPHTPHATPYTRLPSRHRRDPPTLGRPARAKAIGARKSWHRQWCHKHMIMNYTVVFTHPRLYTQDSNSRGMGATSAAHCAVQYSVSVHLQIQPSASIQFQYTATHTKK